MTWTIARRVREQRDQIKARVAANWRVELMWNWVVRRVAVGCSDRLGLVGGVCPCSLYVGQREYM